MSRVCHSIIHYLFSISFIFYTEDPSWMDHEYDFDMDSFMLIVTLQLLLNYLFFPQFLLNHFKYKNNGKCFHVFVKINAPFAPLYEAFDWYFNSKGMYPPVLGCLPWEISWWLTPYYTYSVSLWLARKFHIIFYHLKAKGEKKSPKLLKLLFPSVQVKFQVTIEFDQFSATLKLKLTLNLSLIKLTTTCSQGWNRHLLLCPSLSIQNATQFHNFPQHSAAPTSSFAPPNPLPM